MQRNFIGILILLLALIACQPTTPERATSTFTPPSPSPTHLPSSTATATTLPPTFTATLIPPTATDTSTPTPLVFDVRMHPDGGLFVGDQVSFEVIAPPDMDLSDTVLQISDGSESLLEAPFAPFGIGGRNQATLYWGWDTTDFEAGIKPLAFSIQPLGYTWTHTVTLGSAANIPPPEPVAKWATDESDCCVFYYVTETAASREITTTLATADDLADHAINMLEIDFTEPLIVTLMPRVLGQGGFASSEMYISFLDRNYVGNDFEMVLHHEMVHILDYRLGGEMRPTILIEGLAVYLSGGHYKPEDLIPRSAALLHPSEREDGLGLGWYLPLRPLVDDFYNSQHEIGYMQAGALVEFMVDTWGWAAYSTFYRDILPIENGSQSDAMDAALQTHFGLTLDELEENFLTVLRQKEITLAEIEDVRLTVEFFDTMRRYQQTLNSSAYFLTAWLPNGPLMRERGIVADLVRRPSGVENLALETLLVSANQALRANDHARANESIAAVNTALDAIEAGDTFPFDGNALAKAHYEIAALLLEAGFQVEQVDVADGMAQAIASQGWSDLTVFEFTATANSWLMMSSQQ